MTTNPRFSVQPQAGRPLPADWQQNAPKRAAMAQAHYLFELENAWKRGHEAPDPNTARTARLSGNSHRPLSWDELLGQQ